MVRAPGGGAAWGGGAVMMPPHFFAKTRTCQGTLRTCCGAPLHWNAMSRILSARPLDPGFFECMQAWSTWHLSVIRADARAPCSSSSSSQPPHPPSHGLDLGLRA